MPMGGVAPGVLFIGSAEGRIRFLRPLFEGLCRSGYSRFVEPACGSFGMSHMAIQAGWKPEQVEASDVSLFSSVMGNTIMGRRVDDLVIQVPGFEDEDLGDAATFLWVQSVLQAEAKAAKNIYWRNIAHALRLERDRHLTDLAARLSKAHHALNGLNYEPLDMFVHLERVVDDPNTVVVLNPPILRGDFEKFFNPTGAISWEAPTYSLFDPKEAYKRLYELTNNAQALVLLRTETPFYNGEVEAFACLGSYRKGPNDKGISRSVDALFTSNRPSECRQHLGGSLSIPWKGYPTARPPHPFLPPDFEFTPETDVVVKPIPFEQAMYCRGLWTHRFVGSPAGWDFGVFADGFLVGVFGLSSGNVDTQGTFGHGSDIVFYMYGMAVQHVRGYRLPILLKFLSLSRKSLVLNIPAYTAATATVMRSVDMSQYQYNKGYRARMMVNGQDLKSAIVSRKKDANGVYRTTYDAPIVEAEWRDIYLAWLKREKQWKKARMA